MERIVKTAADKYWN